jgi:Ribbon-helix-helix protein, copG family.
MKEKCQNITIRVPVSMLAEIEAARINLDRSRNWFLLTIIRKALDKKEK